MTTTIRIRQADGITREITVTREQAAAIRQDRTLLDAVRPIRIVDVLPDGRRERIR